MSVLTRKKKLPERPPRYRFALTPLADAMFQLLIFFMLSSSLTPYSLITLRSGAEVAVEDATGAGEDEAPPPEETDIVSAETELWTIDYQQVIVRGTVWDPDDLMELAAALGSEDAPVDVALIVRRNAEVQDVASVLEALQGANIASVRVTPEGGT